LELAFKRFFDKASAFPRFRKKGLHDCFRYPQGFNIDEENSRVWLPKIGWVRYRKSRNIKGKAKQVTVIGEGDHWFVSIQKENNLYLLKTKSKHLKAIKNSQP
jgi:putative transposase